MGAVGSLFDAYARMDWGPGGCQPATYSFQVRVPRSTTPWLWVHRRTSFRAPSTRVCSQRPVDGCRAQAHPSHSAGPSRDSTVPSTVHHQSQKYFFRFCLGSCLHRGPRRNVRGVSARRMGGMCMRQEPLTSSSTRQWGFRNPAPVHRLPSTCVYTSHMKISVTFGFPNVCTCVYGGSHA